MTLEEFIKEATEKHGDKYDYSQVKEQDIENQVNVPIRCNRHGLFWETPHAHLHGLICGCFECYKENNWSPELRK